MDLPFFNPIKRIIPLFSLKKKKAKHKCLNCLTQAEKGHWPLVMERVRKCGFSAHSLNLTNTHRAHLAVRKRTMICWRKDGKRPK
jgi:hypothetical protein